MFNIYTYGRSTRVKLDGSERVNSFPAPELVCSTVQVRPDALPLAPPTFDSIYLSRAVRTGKRLEPRLHK